MRMEFREACRLLADMLWLEVEFLLSLSCAEVAHSLLMNLNLQVEVYDQA